MKWRAMIGTDDESAGDRPAPVINHAVGLRGRESVIVRRYPFTTFAIVASLLWIGLLMSV